MRDLLLWGLLAVARSLDVRGRSKRRELWAFFLLWMAASFITQMFDAMLGTDIAGVGLLNAMGLVPMTVILVTCSIRRFHDINCSGWHVTFAVLPVVLAGLALLAGETSQFGRVVLSTPVTTLLQLGSIWTLIAAVWPGTPGPNRFGEPFVPDAERTIDPTLRLQRGGRLG